MSRWIRSQRIVLGLSGLLVSQSTLLFRRDRKKVERADAYRDLFDALGALYEATARLRPEWREFWRTRRDADLPPKYDRVEEMAKHAACDMRFAIGLLQRYRWKSVVQPLFDEIDDPAWSRFVATASELSPTLLTLADRHYERLQPDEQDWINAAVEQLDEATRRRRIAAAEDTPRARLIAEGAYQPVYIAIQLSERLLERLRMEAPEK